MWEGWFGRECLLSYLSEGLSEIDVVEISNETFVGEISGK